MEHQKQGKKHRKYGRASRKPKTARYNHSRRREKNKIKRVLKSSGYAEARRYAEAHNLLSYLRKIAPSH